MSKFQLPDGVDVAEGIAIATHVVFLECECGCGNLHIQFTNNKGRRFAYGVIRFDSLPAVARAIGSIATRAENRLTHEQVELHRMRPAGEA